MQPSRRADVQARRARVGPFRRAFRGSADHLGTAAPGLGSSKADKARVLRTGARGPFFDAASYPTEAAAGYSAR